MRAIVQSCAGLLAVFLLVALYTRTLNSYSSWGTVGITGNGNVSQLGRLDQIEIGSLWIYATSPDDAALLNGIVEVADLKINPDFLTQDDTSVTFDPVVYRKDIRFTIRSTARC